MNTPLGNLEATAELSVGLMFSLMRNIHLANSTQLIKENGKNLSLLELN